MIPQHCGDVGIAEVKFELTEDNLNKHFLHRKSYTRTKFYCVTNGKGWSVVQVTKKPTRNLFQNIESIRIISSPERTRFVEDPELDVLRIGHLFKVQSDYPNDLVIVKGKFDHISFIDVRLPAKIRLVDVVPPRPSKLQDLISEILGEDAPTLKISLNLIEIDKIAVETSDDTIILPCGSAYDDIHMKSKKRLLFLDRSPELSEKEIKSARLIGCSLSKRIFEELYKSQPRMINMCPKESQMTSMDEIPTISRCCKVKNGVEIDGKWISVPWGANICEVAEALRIAMSF